MPVPSQEPAVSWYRAAARILLLAVAALLVWETLTAGKSLLGSGTDFVEYWSASRLMLAGHNPYDPEQMLAVQRALGFPRNEALLVLNPPWSLPFILPLGLASYAVSQGLWLAFNVAVLGVSIGLCYKLYLDGEIRGKWFGLLGFTFLPALTCLAIGQISLLLLAGLSGFLYFEAKQHDYAAGTSLLLLALKPHCAWLLWPALLCWCWRERRGKILVGLAGAMACATAIALLIDRNVFQHYWEVLHTYGVIRREVPTAWGWLTHITGLRQQWLRFVPVAIGLAWLAWRWQRERGKWSWREQVPAIVLVSLVTSIYGWYFDQVVFLPALYLVLARVIGAGRRTQWALAMLYAGVDLAPGILLLLGFRVFAYAWTAPAWLIVYMLAAISVPQF